MKIVIAARNLALKPFDFVLRKTTGLGLKRLPQWLGVLKDEGRTLGWGAMAREIVATGLRGLWAGKVTGVVWKTRLKRGCGRCPIYDKARKACRDTAGFGLGCGCYMPLKAWIPLNACWLRRTGSGVSRGFGDQA